MSTEENKAIVRHWHDTHHPERKETPMRALCLAPLVAILLLVLGAPGGASAQGTDPAGVFQAFETAFNAHDANAALALFADDGMVKTSPPAPRTTGVFQGKDQIRAWLQASLAQGNLHEESTSIQVSGETLTALSRTSTDALQKLNASPAESNVQVVVQGGKITSMTRVGTPAWVAKLMAGLASARSLPKTGEPVGPLVAVFGLGTGLLGLGLGLRRSCQRPLRRSTKIPLPVVREVRVV